jgi:RimJ/RimL family protein N-acetyltransferase
MHPAIRLELMPSANFQPPNGIVLRILGRADVPELIRHLTELDSEARHDRFNGQVSTELIEAYVKRSIKPGVLVIAAEHYSRVVGMAELHPLGEGTAETAYSVSADFRQKGVGSALFALILEAAVGRGLRELTITTHAGNDAMRRLARRFGAVLHFDHGESHGRILLPKGI